MASAASMFLSDCECCRRAEMARLRRSAGGRCPETQADSLARGLHTTPDEWNDATRGAYRAQRRKDTSV